MAAHYRHAEPADLPRCAELMRRWDRLGYGAALCDRLPHFWQPLVGHVHHVLHVFVDDAADPARGVCGLASGVFVRSDFMAAERDRPTAGLSRRIIELTLEGRSPIATRAELAAGQGGAGVQAVGVDFCLEHDDGAHPRLLRWLPAMLASARDWLSGWRVQSFHREVAGRDLRALARGAAVPSCVLKLPPGMAGDGRPRYLLGAHRADAESRVGALMWWFFQVGDTEFRFTAAQQELLCLALRRHTDAAIAAQLGLSPHTVAMRWRTVLAHASEVRPDRFPPHEPGSPRGAERRSELLAHLRDRMQELRPRPG